MMQNYPAPPPALPKKRRIWPWIIGGFFALSAISSIGRAITQTEPTTYAPVNDVPAIDTDADGDTDMELLRIVWDTTMTASERASICDYYNTPPVGVTSEMVEIFADGADMGYAEAERLLSQLLAEEC